MDDRLRVVAAEIASGSVQAASRLISALENHEPGSFEVLDALPAPPRRAHVIGVTGAPGIGKSTLVSGLIGLLRKRGEAVGVLAVDPSSSVTGGAILGDRIRMQEQAGDPGVFIRSLGSRGDVGGLSVAVASSATVMEAMGKDVVLIETVGAGQSQIDIQECVDTTILVLSSDSGDGIQIMKAGIMEIADIFVVNKADKPGAHGIAADIEHMLAWRSSQDSGWIPPVLETEAITGKGVDAVIEHADAHWSFILENNDDVDRTARRALRDVLDRIRSLYAHFLESDEVEIRQIVIDVGRRKIAADKAAHTLIEAYSRRQRGGS